MSSLELTSVDLQILPSEVHFINNVFKEVNYTPAKTDYPVIDITNLISYSENSALNNYIDCKDILNSLCKTFADIIITKLADGTFEFFNAAVTGIINNTTVVLKYLDKININASKKVTNVVIDKAIVHKLDEKSTYLYNFVNHFTDIEPYNVKSCNVLINNFMDKYCARVHVLDNLDITLELKYSPKYEIIDFDEYGFPIPTFIGKITFSNHKCLDLEEINSKINIMSTELGISLLNTSDMFVDILNISKLVGVGINYLRIDNNKFYLQLSHNQIRFMSVIEEHTIINVWMRNYCCSLRLDDIDDHSYMQYSKDIRKIIDAKDLLDPVYFFANGNCYSTKKYTFSILHTIVNKLLNLYFGAHTEEFVFTEHKYIWYDETTSKNMNLNKQQKIQLSNGYAARWMIQNSLFGQRMTKVMIENTHGRESACGTSLTTSDSCELFRFTINRLGKLLIQVTNKLFCSGTDYIYGWKHAWVSTGKGNKRIKALIKLALPLDGLFDCSGFVIENGINKFRTNKCTVLQIYLISPSKCTECDSTNGYFYINGRNYCDQHCTPMSADKVMVHLVTRKDGIPTTLAMSDYDNNFFYEIGKNINIVDFVSCSVACSSGIHFYLRPHEALMYKEHESSVLDTKYHIGGSMTWQESTTDTEDVHDIDNENVDVPDMSISSSKVTKISKPKSLKSAVKSLVKNFNTKRKASTDTITSHLSYALTTDSIGPSVSEVSSPACAASGSKHSTISSASSFNSYDLYSVGRTSVAKSTATLPIVKDITDHKATRAEAKCSICEVNKVSITLIPCSHKTICYKCYCNLRRKECPVCKIAITNINFIK